MAAMARVRGDAFVAFGVRRFDAPSNVSMTLPVAGRSSVYTSTQSKCFGHTKYGRLHQRQQQPRSDEHARDSCDGHAPGRDDEF